MYSLIEEIEKEYEIDKITVNDFPVWQILRLNYISELTKSDFEERIENNFTIKEKVNNKIIKLMNSTWQVKNIFKNYKYILFTDMLEERKIKGKISDKIAHSIIDLIGKDLLISLNPIYMKHNNIKYYYHKNYISANISHLMQKIFKLKKFKVNINNEYILKNIEERYKININYVDIILDFFSYVRIMNKYFKKHKPEIILVNCYYGTYHQAVIYSAHLNDIKVIELQHGRINKKHYPYNIFRNIGKESFPNYIFTFGEYEKENISDNFIDKQNVIPIGSFYIEYCKESTIYNNDLKQYFDELRNKYRKIVAITSQITVEDRLIDFVKQSAKIDKNILYIFIPRFFNKDFNKYDFPENVTINPKIDFYHTIPFVDFHCTVYSTCALEAPSFGTPNILLNIDNLSCKYLKEIFDSNDICRIANSPEQLVDIIINWSDIDVNRVINKGNLFYKTNNYINVKKALNKILL